ncbi:MAG TPA: hypothetical protein VF867_03215 [Arthrobacter sp.]
MSSFQPRQTIAAPRHGSQVPFNSGQQNRRLIGTPGAGQFTHTQHGETGVSLAAPAPAFTGPAYIRIPKQVFAAVRSMVSNTIRKVRGRSMEPKPYGRTGPFSAKAKGAVAGLVLVIGAGAGVTGCSAGDNHPSGCQAAPASIAVTATTASFTTAVPAKGGGHGGSGGHSSSHGSTGHGSTGESSAGGGHVSAPVHIPTVTPTSGAPLRQNYTPAPSTNGGSMAPYIFMTHPHSAASQQHQPAEQCAPTPGPGSNV